jgi:ABC-type sulfate/molybdate transport systems ATPase subunit
MPSACAAGASHAQRAEMPRRGEFVLIQLRNLGALSTVLGGAESTRGVGRVLAIMSSVLLLDELRALDAKVG